MPAEQPESQSSEYRQRFQHDGGDVPRLPLDAARVPVGGLSMAERKLPAWLRVIFNLCGPAGLGVTLMGWVKPGLGLFVMAIGLVYILWEIGPWTIKKVRRHPLLSLLAFTLVGAVLGAASWSVVKGLAKPASAAVVPTTDHSTSSSGKEHPSQEPAQHPLPIPTAQLPVVSTPKIVQPEVKTRRFATLVPTVQSAPPSQIINAPNGIAIGGGQVGSATVNNFGVKPTPPEIEWRPVPIKPWVGPLYSGDREAEMRAFNSLPDEEKVGRLMYGNRRQVIEGAGQIGTVDIEKPMAGVRFTLKGTFASPGFIAKCNVPCAFLMEFKITPTDVLSDSRDVEPLVFPNDPTLAGVSFTAHQIFPGVVRILVFQSLDKRELQIRDFQTLAQ